MTYEEIIRKIRERDEAVTRCFFFWDGPTLQHIDAVRRTDPAKASKMRRPICGTCRPGLLSVLHKIYGSEQFNYTDMVTMFYCHLMEGDKLASIKDSRTLMGWIVTTAYFFFLKEKMKVDSQLLDFTMDDSLNVREEDGSAGRESRQLVRTILDAMPNAAYARILDDVVLELPQYTGAAKAEFVRMKAEELGISTDNLYVKIHLAKKQFKDTADKLL